MRMQRQIVDSPSLEILKTQVDVGLTTARGDPTLSREGGTTWSLQPSNLSDPELL